MNMISVSELCYTSFDFEITDVFPESWRDRREFSLYKQKQRPCSALFFVCADIEVSFYRPNGSLLITVKRGDVAYIPKGMCYYVRVSGEDCAKIDTYTVNLHLFDAQRQEFLLADTPQILARRQDHRQDVYLKELSDAFHGMKQTAHGDRYNRAKAKGELLLLLDMIASANEQNDDIYYPIRKGVELFCDEWSKNEKIEKYAQLCGVSETYFYRCFRKWSGKSPVAYRNMLRLSNAESLLRSTDMKIQEISKLIGYDDPFYFCRLFCNTYGISPKQYRAKFQD